MWTSSETPPLPPNIFVILRDLIHEATGLYYDQEKADLLAEKLAHRVLENNFSSFLDYYYLLKYGPDAEREWPHVLNALSVQETYFAREMAQIEAFVGVILPAYVREHPHQPVEIWCAACATGEEPLTIAMALNEAGWFDNAEVRIMATDASSEALAKAGEGVYRERSFRALGERFRHKYFQATERGWQVDPALHRRVQFARANLVAPETASVFGHVPFVFCRNVFIYFSDVAMRRTLENLSRSMVRPGYLFVGASESLLRITTEFELEAVGEAFAYALR
jgi:chemotaxis protein methyltransferase CheR